MNQEEELSLVLLKKNIVDLENLKPVRDEDVPVCPMKKPTGIIDYYEIVYKNEK